jgi:fatty acid desaturase
MSATTAPRAERGPAILRPAVLAGPDKLSPAARAEIQTLSGARPLRFFSELLLNWAIVAVAIGVAVQVDGVLVTLLAICVVATRQMVFGLLLHEQVHRLGLRGKYADWLVNALAVYPLFATTVENYAKVHLMHHKYFMTRRDPDFVRKAGPEWEFPACWRIVALTVLRDLTGMNTIKLIKGKTAGANADEFLRRNPSPLWFRIGYYSVLAAVLTYVQGWTVFLIYWVAPILTITQLLVRWIAVCEHKYNQENGDLLLTTPLLRLKPWQRVLLPDLNFAMHVYHHAHAGVSFSNLPRVHAIYQREGLVDESAVFDGQGAYLKYLFKRARPS